MNRDRINKFLSQVPTQAIIILIMLIWILPTLGLLITSLRPVQSVNSSGWWTVLAPPQGAQYGPTAQVPSDGKASPRRT
jgi:ABC-type glycerol-3-phosphate transport system permease component